MKQRGQRQLRTFAGRKFSRLELLSLKLDHFKNYERLDIGLSPRLNCFVGLNGMGKTNLLDAVYFLCLTKSHRGLPDRNLVRHGETFFRIEGVFHREQQRFKVAAKYLSGQRKELERNGVAYTRLSDHIGQFPVVMIAPDDVALVQDGSEERRRFLDTTLSQIFPEYLQNLLIYSNLLKQRNALLKQFGETRRFDPTLLEALDRQMPAPAQAIFEKRTAFVESFRPLFNDCYAAISNSRETAALHYESDLLTAPLDELLLRQRDKDRAQERTGAGPHRDDVALSLDGQALRKFASQGQLKSFLLALRLAQYEVLRQQMGVSPILLLDDIFDKLDEHRVRHLVQLLIDRRFGQTFITDTQRSRMESVIASFSDDYRIFEVENGGIPTLEN